ncbi:MAG: hypothetical protein IT561_17160 [Alphaproteobacteria bacterium]|nr:hypothetical protein [Alphaproteobacteria bacterium]
MVRVNRWLGVAAALVATGCISIGTSGNGAGTSPPGPPPGPQTAAIASAAPEPPAAPRVAVPSVATKDLPSKACMTDRERRYDLIVRLQTELSVTGLTCQWKAEKGKNLLDQYATFSRRHHQLLLDTQSEHGRFLARHEKGSAPRLFDRYRTILANEEMMVAGKYGHPDYCADRYAKFTEVVNYDAKKLDAWLEGQGKLRAKEYRACK